MMVCLCEAISQFDGSVDLVVKPHPACDIKPSSYPELSFQLSRLPLSRLFSDCDLVLTSNATSAAVDAYCFGLTVIQMLGADKFNLSPLRGHDNVCFVCNPTELLGEFTRWQHQKVLPDRPYFNLDPQLKGWKSLLEIY